MKFETLILKKEEGVATIVLNRLEVLNAINQKMREELRTVVDVVRSNDVKVVVFTGAGRAFCSGGDVEAQKSKVESYDPVKRRDDLRLGNDLILGITKLEKTTKDLAIEISKGPSIPIRMAKHIIYKGMSMDLVSVLEYETLAQVLCVQTEDHREGVKAFLERREPLFRGV